MHNTMDGRDPAQLRQMISESALVFVTQHHVWDPAWVARTLLRLSTLHKVKVQKYEICDINMGANLTRLLCP